MTNDQALHNLASEFFRVFARTEYALKATGFNRGDGPAEPNWGAFALAVETFVSNPPNEELRKAIELQPHFAEAYNNLGLALNGQGKPDDAIAAYRKAIELKPDLAFAYGNLGNELRAQRKFDEAASAYRKAIELEPDSAKVYNDLGAMLRDQGKWEEVLELVKKVVELNPQESMNWQSLGWAYYRTGDWQACIDAMEKSCNLHDNGVGDAFHWFFLAMAHWQLGQHEEARTWYDKAVQNENGWSDVLRRLRTEAAELLGESKENNSSNAQ